VQLKETEDPEPDTLKDGTPAAKDKKKSPRKLVKDEHREEGSVKWSVYNIYLKAMEGFLPYFPSQFIETLP